MTVFTTLQLNWCQQTECFFWHQFNRVKNIRMNWVQFGKQEKPNSVCACVHKYVHVNMHTKHDHARSPTYIYIYIYMHTHLHIYIYILNDTYIHI